MKILHTFNSSKYQVLEKSSLDSTNDNDKNHKNLEISIVSKTDRAYHRTDCEFEIMHRKKQTDHLERGTRVSFHGDFLGALGDLIFR